MSAREEDDTEAKAWAWLEKKFGTPESDPVDRAYDASEMVDAFHAGEASRHSGVLGKLVEALEDVLDPDPCRLDHNENCQAHFVTSPCEVATARSLIAHIRQTGAVS